MPFCRSICSYCDFTHQAYREKTADAWLQALAYEIDETDIPDDLETCYIGGGTPTSLTNSQLETLLSLLDPFVRKTEEYTVEVNPETLDDEKAETLVHHGISRASIGLQTANEALLKKLGRRHTCNDVRNTVQILKKHGIDNISLDLMYSLPDQTMQDLENAIAFALSLEPKHLSLYSLTIEENTVFGKTGVEPLDEDMEADMYEYICKRLPEEGYMQYEISNFAKEGYESKHNLVYWHYKDFIGLSCGASGKVMHCRYDNAQSLKEYLKDPLMKEYIPLTKEDEMFETVMMGLRLVKGISLSGFQARYGCTFEQAFGNKAKKLLEEGKLVIEDDMLRCNDQYYHLLNSLLCDLL